MEKVQENTFLKARDWELKNILLVKKKKTHKKIKNLQNYWASYVIKD